MAALGEDQQWSLYVLMRESAQRHFVSWRGRCLLVSAPNMRSASSLEAGDVEGRVQELDRLEDNLGDAEKTYGDISHEKGEEEEKISKVPQ